MTMGYYDGGFYIVDEPAYGIVYHPLVRINPIPAWAQRAISSLLEPHPPGLMDQASKSVLARFN